MMQPALHPGQRPAVPQAEWALACLVAAAMAFRVCFAAGLSGNDDLAISGEATRLIEQGFTFPTYHYAARWGLILPLAGVYGVFGVGVWQLVALPLLASAAGMLLAYGLGRRFFDARVGLFAAFALAVYPMDIEFSGLFFPDLPAGTLLAASFYCATTRRGGRTRVAYAVLAGLLWAWAYYVKVDAFFFGFVLLLAAAMGYLAWRDLVLVGAVAAAAVGCELVSYGVLTGDPLHRVHLESAAANEVLAADRNYRQFFIYPKAMFLAVYETGLHFYLLVAAAVFAIARRSKPALFFLGWVGVFHLWLTLGGDPFGGGYVLKPQLPRYLLVYAVPMAVAIGWLLARLATAAAPVTRRVTALGCAALCGAAVLFTQLNLFAYEPAAATRIGVETALHTELFPLYTDPQSINIVRFMLAGRPELARAKLAQEHNFLTGKTVLKPIEEDAAYLLLNHRFIRRLAERNLVTPLEPGQFGARVEVVARVGEASSSLSGAVLHGVVALARLVPVAAVRERVARAAQELTAGDRATLYKLSKSS